MKTEEEARRCWCPFAKLNTGIAPDRYVDGVGFFCIASDCMAWRWGPEPSEYETNPQRPRPGYCGLVGKP